MDPTATPTPGRASGSAVLTPVGDLDLVSAPALGDAIRDALRDRTVHTVTVDLAGVTFLDCAGVSTLLAGHATAARRGQQVVVANPRRWVRRVLTLTGALSTLQPVRPGARPAAA